MGLIEGMQLKSKQISQRNKLMHVIALLAIYKNTRLEKATQNFDIADHAMSAK